MLKGSPLLEKLAYGPAPESTTAAMEWISKHDKKFGFFVNGEMQHPEGRAYSEITNPSNGEILCEVIEGDAVEDVDCAVTAAARAQQEWAQLGGHQRARVLYAVARTIQKHQRLFAVIESLDNGKPVRESRDADVPLAVRHFYYHAGWAQLQQEELRDYEPVGVIAQVIPWNFPLLMLAWKVAPALAMGNAVVLKPAPSTPLTALLFAEVCAEAGVPAGVVNILPGGNDLGFNLVNHSQVDKVAFTGSTNVGRLLRESTAGTGKKLSLELGGKSPFIVFETADLDSAVEGVVDAIFYNQGEVCCAGSRLLVQEGVAERFIAKLKRRMDNLLVGDALDKCIDVGAINSRRQYESVMGHIERATAEGCEVYQSEQVKEGLPTHGFFIPPTLITGCQSSSSCVIHEIFGPVLTLMTFRSPSEAVSLANNTAYGLAGSVWTEDISTALDIAFRVRAGVIWINAHNLFDAAAGFGGYKESGFGRESGREGLMEYVRPIYLPHARVTLSEETKGAPWGCTVPSATLAPGVAAVDGERVNRTAKMYIGGKQARPDAPYAKQILAKDGRRLGEAGEGNRKDIRNAVEAAHKAAPGWGKRAAYNRAQILFYIAENLDARFGEFAGRIEAMTGCGQEAAEAEVRASISRLFMWAAYADKHGGEVQETPLYGATVSIREAVGVIGIACPDEFPLLALISLIAPAIVRGNAVVVVPSEKYPLSATDLYQVLETSDLPAGVVNIVTGNRDHLTLTLSEHMNVDAMWYFGSEVGSYHVERLSSVNLKRTLVNYGAPRNWMDDKEGGAAQDFLYHACQVKNIWIPAGI